MTPVDAMEAVNVALASGLGLGFAPVAPGTVGSLWGLALAWWLGGYSVSRQALLIAVLAIMAVPVCHWASVTYFAGLDAGSIVLDEIVAFPLALAGLSLAGGLPVARRPAWLLLAFGLFRLFDGLKPPPVRLAEALPGGVGIVADDLVAAGLAWGCMAALIWLMARRRRQESA